MPEDRPDKYIKIAKNLAIEIFQQCLDDIVSINRYIKYKQRIKSSKYVLKFNLLIENHHEAVSWLRHNANESFWFEVLNLNLSKNAIEKLIEFKLNANKISVEEFYEKEEV